MKTAAPRFRSSRPPGFTLLEMIGVIAVMGILAAVVTPNALRTIERAAVRAEADTLHSLGEQAKIYLRETGSEPTTGNWNMVLATYMALSPTDVLYNRRQSSTGPITRLYVPDPFAPAGHGRGMFFSSMRTGVALPTVANISAYFANIWNTPIGVVPGTAPGLPAAGWGNWNASNVEYLVIERVNFRPIHASDLQDLPIVLTGAGAPSYQVVRADGTVVRSGRAPDSFNAHPNQKLNLYSDTDWTVLNSTYVLTNRGGQFNCSGGVWTPSGP